LSRPRLVGDSGGEADNDAGLVTSESGIAKNDESEPNGTGAPQMQRVQYLTRRVRLNHGNG
jgi:hypothetical protein